MFDIAHLAQIIDGKWLQKTCGAQSVASLQTDSRQNCVEAFFLAFKGEKFDAHDYLLPVIEAGARVICVEKIPANEVLESAKNKNCGVLLVADTVKAYQQIAREHLQKIACEVVGITGSSGKTSVKTIVSILLESCRPGEVLATAANTNNHIGVPQNILRLHPGQKFAILEMGTNNPGEIAVLAKCATPDIAVITSIGDSHAGNFPKGGILWEKTDIIRYMNPKGTAIIPYNLRSEIASTGVLKDQTVITFGEEIGADYRVECSEQSLKWSRIKVSFKGAVLFERQISLTGKHQALNVAASVAVVRQLGIAVDDILPALESLELPGMRMRVTEQNGITWINDAYNANPQSTQAFIEWLKSLKISGRVVLILGDMLELGESSLHYHQQIEHLLPPNWHLIAVGTFYSQVLQKTAQCFANSAAVIEKFSPQLGDVVALKGSRGMKLELIQNAFLNKDL